MKTASEDANAALAIGGVGEGVRWPLSRRYTRQGTKGRRSAPDEGGGGAWRTLRLRIDDAGERVGNRRVGERIVGRWAQEAAIGQRRHRIADLRENIAPS